MSELIHGNAIEVLASRPAKSIDMIYSDPPFNTGQVWKGKAGSFDDRWKRSDATDAGWSALKRHSPEGANLMKAASAGHASLRAYLGMMASLLLECRRSLKLTGTIWLHFDDTAGAHLRLLLEVVFGLENQLGTLIWKRSSGVMTTKGFPKTYDTIAVCARSMAARYRLWRIGKMCACPMHPESLIQFHDIVDERYRALGPTENERVGYPTQKPVDLIASFIELATLPGDVVCDPTMGSGTTVVACERTNRSAIGIDMSADAVAVARDRLKKAPKHQFDMFGAVA